MVLEDEWSTITDSENFSPRIEDLLEKPIHGGRSDSDPDPPPLAW